LAVAAALRQLMLDQAVPVMTIEIEVVLPNRL
jgi:hypothetical protein